MFTLDDLCQIGEHCIEISNDPEVTLTAPTLKEGKTM